MIRVSEREIENCLKEFNKRDIVLKMKGIVIAEVKMELARCVYNRTVGILEVDLCQVFRHIFLRIYIFFSSFA